MSDEKKFWDLADREDLKTAEKLYVVATLEMWADHLSGKKPIKRNQWDKCAAELEKAARWIQRRYLDAAMPSAA